MAVQNPPEDFVAWLTGQTVNSRALVSGTNLFACEPRVSGPDSPVFPTKAIFVWSAGGGGVPRPHLGLGQRSIFQPRLQVRVRGEPGAVQEARLTCRELLLLVQRTRILSGYMSMLANESEPIPLGERNSGGAEFQFNVDFVFSAA